MNRRIEISLLCLLSAAPVLAGSVEIPAGEVRPPAERWTGGVIKNLIPFHMDATEVTWADWKRIRDWALQHGYAFEHSGYGKADDHPVVGISWFDCVKWCNAQSEMEKRRPAYEFNGEVYRTGVAVPTCSRTRRGNSLPTPEEWRFGAHGGESSLYAVDDTIDHDKANFQGMPFDPKTESTGFHPDYTKGGRPYTAPVMAFAANAYGLYGMAGNVKEWIDGTPSTTTEYGLVFGGAFNSSGLNCSSDLWQAGLPLTSAVNTIGFRTVHTIE